MAASSALSMSGDSSLASLGDVLRASPKASQNQSEGSLKRWSLKGKVQHEAASREFTEALAGREVLEIGISCKHLPKMDLFGLSDPFAVIFLMHGKQALKLGTTETVYFSLNPRFVHSFDIPLNTPAGMRLKCEVYDRDSTSDQLSKHDYIGACEVPFGELAKAESEVSRAITNDLGSKRTRKHETEVTFHTARINMPAKIARWEICVSIVPSAVPAKAKNLYFCAFRSDAEPEAGKRANYSHQVLRSQLASKSEGFEFRPMSMPVERILVNRRERVLRLDIVQYEGKGDHIVLGSMEMNFRDMLKLNVGDEVEMYSRRGDVVGKAQCSRSMIGDQMGGRLYTTGFKITKLGA